MISIVLQTIHIDVNSTVRLLSESYKVMLTTSSIQTSMLILVEQPDTHPHAARNAVHALLRYPPAAYRTSTREGPVSTAVVLPSIVNSKTATRIDSVCTRPIANAFGFKSSTTAVLLRRKQRNVCAPNTAVVVVLLSPRRRILFRQ